jgi:peptidoglycan/LPS O-acetylase OafA/YrhL
MQPLRYLGYISYGLYLYHLLLFFMVAQLLARFRLLQGSAFTTVVERFVLMFSLSVLVAHISRRWLEQPFLDWNRRKAE